MATAPKVQQHEVTIHLPGLEQVLEKLAHSVWRVTNLAENHFQHIRENERLRREDILAARQKEQAAEFKKLRAEGSLLDVWLVWKGENHIQVIKEIREITKLGLKEAKEIVDLCPHVIVEGVTLDQADYVQKRIFSAGGGVELRRHPPDAA